MGQKHAHPASTPQPLGGDGWVIGHRAAMAAGSLNRRLTSSVASLAEFNGKKEALGKSCDIEWWQRLREIYTLLRPF
jgi:hypothetical protein